jgi:phosphate transport system protein
MPVPQMESLKERLVASAGLVEQMIVQGGTALAERRPALLAAVIDEEEPRANSLEMELEEECTSLIAQHQPMGRDLRTLLMILRITGDLERMADHAVNIAESVRLLLRDGLGQAEPLGMLATLFAGTIGMVHCAIQSFAGQDAGLGQRVCESDEAVDSLATAVLELASRTMAGDPAGIAQSLAVLKIAGNLERIADLATNIGEDVIYMAEGRVIKHHHHEEAP